MLIKEFRIVLPISVEEYQVGQLYAVAEASKNETGGGEGVEVLVNEPYEKDGEKGQYTHKVYHMQSKVPAIVRICAPKGSLSIHEKAWNAYPYCRTILTSEYKKDFQIKIETWHKNDMGDQENVHNIEKSLWDQTQVVNIDIADKASINPKEYKAEMDPAVFKSEKTGRGPLGPNWKEELANNSSCPHMCAYKLATVEAKFFPLTGKVEGVIQRVEQRIFTHFHRQLFCWIDKWIDLSMDDIRRMEEDTKKELDDMRLQGEVKGMNTDEE
ncbi:phosphatidylinositol transfer protein alpha isoform-like [Nelusetta ayraudi]|uniref:phosphatidylinositol transfer protein alpha isoform-like n=1 Tax=Nelusetta ayraudi TaxID=303726 RepID=UPI003F729D52